MLDYKAIGRIPETVGLSRNGKQISASRVKIGEIDVVDRALRIADVELIQELPPLSVRVKNGQYDVYAYEWSHPRGNVNVCVVVHIKPLSWAFPRRLKINNNPFRPDLTDGLMVDFGAIAIQSGNSICVTAGLGDGYYPVFVNRNCGLFLQSIIVDFKIWEIPNILLLPGQRLDEYGMVVNG